MGKPISQKKLLSIAGLGWMFDAMDVGMLSFIIAALKIDWDLTPQQMGWIGSVNSIGMAVGALLFGLWADRIGRKKIFIITLLIIFHCKWVFSTNHHTFCISYIQIFYWDGTWWGITSCINISI